MTPAEEEEDGQSLASTPSDDFEEGMADCKQQCLSIHAPSFVSMGKEGIALERTLGLFNAVALIVGIIVGSGIFISPRYVLQECGSVGVTLIVWVVCGIICLLGALCFAELSMRITRPGGVYAYIEETWGDLVGFLYIWMSVIVVFPASNAIISKACGKYLLQPLFPCGVPYDLDGIMAAIVIIFLTYVNCSSVRVAAVIQDGFTILKTLALLVIIITGVVIMCIGESKLNFKDLFAHTTADPGRLAIGLYGGLFAYSGWYSITFLTEELKKPLRDLPRAMYISLPLTTVIYTLTNVAYFAVLGREGMLQSDAVAFTLAEKLYGVMDWSMPLLVACSCFGSLNGFFMSVPRLFFVGATKGHLPDFLALVSAKTLTPLPSVILEGVLSVLMLLAGNIDMLMTCAMFVESLAFLLCCVTFFMERLKSKQRPQNGSNEIFEVPIIYAVLFTISMVFLLIIPLVTAFRDVLMSLFFIVAGIPVYFVCVRCKRKPRLYKKYMGIFFVSIQKLIEGVMPEDTVTSKEK